MKWPHFSSSQGILLMLVFTLITLLMLCPFQVAYAQGSSNTIVSVKPSTTMPYIGETVTVNITLSNVQNLYALDVTLEWNTSVLQVLNAKPRLGVESYPDGVLHVDVQIVEDNASQATGQYRLVATSVAPAAPFSGSGNIATITFNVTSIGHSELKLATELADYPPPYRDPRVSIGIQHTDVGASIYSVIPEFSNIVILVLLAILATIVSVISKKIPKKAISDSNSD